MKFDLSPEEIYSIKNTPNKIIFDLYVKPIVAGTNFTRNIDLHLVPADKVDNIASNMTYLSAFDAEITARDFLGVNAHPAAVSVPIYKDKPWQPDTSLSKYFAFDLTDALKEYFDENPTATSFGFVLASPRGQELLTAARLGAAYPPRLVIPEVEMVVEDLPATGLIWDSWDFIIENQEEEPAVELFAELPSSVDLTSEFPAPHSVGQGSQQASCVAWAVAYALKSGQENIAHNWEFNTPASPPYSYNYTHIFSPSYVYNQLNGGSSSGYISIGAAMGIIVDQGICSLESLPYVSSNWTTQPTQQQKDEAAQFKAVSWNSVIGLNNITRHLADGDGVIIGINVLPQFDKLNTAGVILPPSPPVAAALGISEPYVFDNATLYPTSQYPTGIRGTHAICLIGYDDDMGAFKYINGWGTNRGFNGYGWIAYNMLSDQNVNIHGVEHGYVLKSHYEINATAVKFDSTENALFGTVIGSGLYNPGAVVHLTAIPDNGYVFSGWYENGVQISVEDELNFQATADRSLEARFMKNSGSTPPVYIVVTAGPGGTTTGDGIYSEGYLVELIATPDNGYTFDGWYEDNVKISGAGATYSFTAEEFRMLEARFN
jgi:hypothetical protein